MDAVVAPRSGLPFLLLAVLAAPMSALAAPAAETYLRLSVIHERSESSGFRDQRCTGSEGYAGYFGCGPGEDGRALGAQGDFGNSTGLELAVGRRLGPYWRGEAVLAYQPDLSYRGDANFLNAGAPQPVSGSVRHWRAAIETQLDLAALAGRAGARVAPYLGLDVGVTRNRVSTMVYEFPELQAQPALTRVPGATTTGFGWGAVLGADIRVSERASLDIGLTYHDHGRVQTARDDIEVVRRGDVVATVPVERTRADLKTRGLRLGFRRYF